jgi:hypothetical protein
MSVDLGKAKKILSKAFLDTNSSVTEAQANSMVVKSEMTIKEIREEMNANESLAAAQQIVADLKKSYKSAIEYEEAKIQFLLTKIEELQQSIVTK